MSVNNYDELRPHIGHNIVVVGYGEKGKKPENVAIECEDCFEVLKSFDLHPDIEDEEKEQG